MSKVQAIPSVPKAGEDRSRFDSAIKERLEILFGERGDGKAALLSDIPDVSGIAAAGAVDVSMFALKGANSDITELAGLSVPLSVEQGGTGQAYLLIPPGAMMPYGGLIEPKGWLLCDGRNLSTDDYPALFEHIGYAFGGSGGLFNIPDLRGRTFVGCTAPAGNIFERVTVAGSGINGAVVGASGGNETHTLTITEMPAHTHDYSYFGAGGGSVDYTAGGTQSASGPTTSTGGGGKHNNMQPSLVCNAIIKY